MKISKCPLKIVKEDSYSADEKIYEIIKLVGLEGLKDTTQNSFLVE